MRSISLLNVYNVNEINLVNVVNVKVLNFVHVVNEANVFLSEISH